MGKWYTSVSDFRHAQQQAKNPPLFKKLFAAGSVEEEALQLLIHEKKITEQEKELQQMLNMRYGFGTWDELVQMRRNIRKKREATVYAQEQRQRAFIEAVSIGVAILVFTLMVGGLVYGVGLAQGRW